MTGLIRYHSAADILNELIAEPVNIAEKEKENGVLHMKNTYGIKEKRHLISVIIIALITVLAVSCASADSAFAAKSKSKSKSKAKVTTIKITPFTAYSLHEHLIGGPETESKLTYSSVKGGAKVLVNDISFDFVAFKPGTYKVTTRTKATSTNSAGKRVTKFIVKNVPFKAGETGLLLTDIETDSVSFMFSPNSNASAYRIQYRTAGEEWNKEQYVKISQKDVIKIYKKMHKRDYDSPDSYITVSGLSGSTGYEFRLSAKIKGKWKNGKEIITADTY